MQICKCTFVHEVIAHQVIGVWCDLRKRRSIIKYVCCPATKPHREISLFLVLKLVERFLDSFCIFFSALDLVAAMCQWSCYTINIQQPIPIQQETQQQNNRLYGMSVSTECLNEIESKYRVVHLVSSNIPMRCIISTGTTDNWFLHASRMRIKVKSKL